MSGITEIQARIQAIQHRPQPPAIAGHFQALLNAKVSESDPPVVPNAIAPAETV